MNMYIHGIQREIDELESQIKMRKEMKISTTYLEKRLNRLYYLRNNDTIRKKNSKID